MEYRKILAKEIGRKRRNCADVDDGNSHRRTTCHSPHLDDVFSSKGYLDGHVPSPDDVAVAFRELAFGDGNVDGEPSPMLVPVRTFLRVRLAVTSNRLCEMVALYPWMVSWMEYIRGLQEMKIFEMFGSGNMEDGRMKWLLWSILGESVDITVCRSSTADGTESILMELNQ
jgi:hypothetical protein